MDSSFVEIGRIVKPFGVKGGLKIHLFIDDPEDIKGIKEFFIKDKKLGWRPLEVGTLQFEENVEFAKGTFPEIPDRTAAEIWRQVSLYIPREKLKPVKDAFFIGDLVGCSVVQGADAVGVVDNLLDVADTDMLVVKMTQQMLVIPMTERYIDLIDVDQRVITVRNIDELL
ncbi:MAG: ribosome maturation factor RimM [Brevinema sp.]